MSKLNESHANIPSVLFRKLKHFQHIGLVLFQIFVQHKLFLQRHYIDVLENCFPKDTFHNFFSKILTLPCQSLSNPHPPKKKVILDLLRSHPCRSSVSHVSHQEPQQLGVVLIAVAHTVLVTLPFVFLHYLFEQNKTSVNMEDRERVILANMSMSLMQREYML